MALDINCSVVYKWIDFSIQIFQFSFSKYILGFISDDHVCIWVHVQLSPFILSDKEFDRLFDSNFAGQINNDYLRKMRTNWFTFWGLYSYQETFSTKMYSTCIDLDSPIIPL